MCTVYTRWPSDKLGPLNITIASLIEVVADIFAFWLLLKDFLCHGTKTIFCELFVKKLGRSVEDVLCCVIYYCPNYQC